MLIELSTQIIIDRKVSEVITVYFLTRIDALSDNEHNIDHVFRPGCIIVIAIDEDILKRVKLPTSTLLHAKSDLIVDVVVQVIKTTYRLIHLIPKEDCGLKQGFDVGIEVGETQTALFGLAMRVYEED